MGTHGKDLNAFMSCSSSSKLPKTLVCTCFIKAQQEPRDREQEIMFKLMNNDVCFSVHKFTELYPYVVKPPFSCDLAFIMMQNFVFVRKIEGQSKYYTHFFSKTLFSKEQLINAWWIFPSFG